LFGAFVALIKKSGKMKNIHLLIFSISLCLLSSCVAKRKFLAMTNQANSLRQDSLKLAGTLTDTREELVSTKQKMDDLQKELDALKAANAQKDLQLTSSSSTIEEQQKRMEALQKLIDQQRNVVGNLQKTIHDALGQYKAEDLNVYIKDGKVYVSMQEQLLFKSGSAIVNKAGVEALGKIAQVLNTDPKIQIMVEGHTDSIPIRKNFPDNWALSSARSLSIVRVLTNQYKVDPTRLIAAGHSYFDPVQSNSTEEGRALNRRTEIILTPNLDELYKLME
jgi:chemotaxis protein MotB